MLRVGIVVSTLGFGGNERSAINIYNALKKVCDVKLIPMDGSEYENTELGKDDFIDLNTPASSSFFIRIIHSILRIIRIKKIIKKEKLDIVYFILNESTILSKIKLKNTIKIISCRDCGRLMRNTSTFKKNLDNSDYIVFNSKYMQDYFLNRYPDMKNKTACIYNILDFDLIEKLSKQNLDEKTKSFFDGKFVVTSVGRFCDEKGYNHLIRAFSHAKEHCPNLALCLIGDGFLMEKIQSMVEQSGYEKDILLTGFDKNPFKYERESDLFVLSSITEGFPNSLIEAMVIGIPVVATNCTSGPMEILNPSNKVIDENDTYCEVENGILIPPFVQDEDYSFSTISNEEKILASAIIDLYNNPSLYIKYSKRCSSLERYQSDTVRNQYLSLFNYLTRNKKEIML